MPQCYICRARTAPQHKAHSLLCTFWHLLCFLCVPGANLARECSEVLLVSLLFVTVFSKFSSLRTEYTHAYMPLSEQHFNHRLWSGAVHGCWGKVIFMSSAAL